MTPLEEFKDILKEHGCEIPEDSLEVFRDLMDTQSDLILDRYLSAKIAGEKAKNVVK
jgi:hypothetical protein